MPSFLINDVPCGIYIGPDGQDGGIQERYDYDGGGAQADVVIQCPWPQRYQVIMGLLGAVQLQNAGNNQYNINRTPPMQYPLPPALIDQGDGNGGLLPGRMICTSIGTIRGVKARTDEDGGTTGLQGWLYYALAQIPATFTNPVWQTIETDGTLFSDAGQLLAGAYAITRTKASGEVFAPPTGSVVFAAGAFAGQPLVDVHASFIRARTEIEIELLRMPFIPGVIQQSIGTCNNAPVTIGNINYPLGSILFVAMTTEEIPDPISLGTLTNIKLSFIANAPAAGNPINANTPLDWNMNLDPSGQWNYCWLNQAQKAPIFPYSNFAAMFSNPIS
jgi:hypothetical protein